MDVTQEVNAVERSVGSRILAAGKARTVTLSRIYESPIEEVWEACTTRDGIQRWFLPILGDLTVGGRFQIEGNAGGNDREVRPSSELLRHVGNVRRGELDRASALTRR
jgi:hypothetical protein